MLNVDKLVQMKALIVELEMTHRVGNVEESVQDYLMSRLEILSETVFKDYNEKFALTCAEVDWDNMV